MPGELNSVATDFFAALDALDADRMKQMLTEGRPECRRDLATLAARQRRP